MRVANKLRGMISLAQKAGKIVSGETAVRAAIQKGQAVMLLAEEGASANTKDTMNKLATAYALPLLYVEDVGAAIGKEGQNARLAAKLTGWKIDIKSQSQMEESMGV